MKFRVAYYIAESGKILEICEKYHKDFIEFSDKASAYIESIGGNGFIEDLKGQIGAVRFEGKRPEGFKVPNSKGCCEPYKKSDWNDKLKALGNRPLPENYIREFLNMPECLKYETENSSGTKTIGHYFSPYQICWFSKTGPFLVAIADIKKEVKLFYAENPKGKITNNLEDWQLPAGLKPILGEEWDLMAVVHKRKQEELESNEQ